MLLVVLQSIVRLEDGRGLASTRPTHLALADHNIAVDKNVVEEEELPGLGLFTAHLGQNSLTDQHPAGDQERLEGHQEGCIRVQVRVKSAADSPGPNCRSSPPPWRSAWRWPHCSLSKEKGERLSHKVNNARH